jgi:hypothetical protein
MSIEQELFAPLSRRDFMRAGGGAALAALAGSEPRQLSAATLPAKADIFILLWMAGGMAQTETFDPKKKTPFEPGLRGEHVLSTFDPIDTVVDNIKISEGLDRIAKVMDRGALIRTHRVGDLGQILHTKHQYHWHTGYAPPQPLMVPHMGAFLARTLGPRHPDVPAFINIGQNLELGAESDAVKAFHTAGFLGAEYGPFLVDDPNDATARVRPPAGFTEARFHSRYEAYRKLQANNPVLKYGSGFQQESLLHSVEGAHRLLSSPAAKAFDLSLEPKKSFEIYNTGKFGLGCLLARRLAEAGARFIEVSSEYIPFRFWDTHENGHTRTMDMKKSIDGPVSQLILDLEERGMLNRTLIVLASEFGRDIVMEGKPGKDVLKQDTQPDVMTQPKHYGMHRHFTEAGSVLLFGGGIKKGFLYGKTADERPCKVIENPVTIEDLHATIYRSMGIPADLSYEVEKRPFYVTRDGKGKAVMDLFA